jgi:hypothetical protein
MNGNISNSETASSEEKVLQSTYPPITIPSDTSIVQLLLARANENVRIGRTNWLVSSDL